VRDDHAAYIASWIKVHDDAVEERYSLHSDIRLHKQVMQKLVENGGRCRKS
jgi:hypothetical protein